MKTFEHGLEELVKVLELSCQQWFLGAGASVESGIPLMHALTNRVRAIVPNDSKEIVGLIFEDLPPKAHIEHALSHLGDLIAIAQRARTNKAKIGAKELSLTELEKTYGDAIQAIAITVRHGYFEEKAGNPEQIGSSESPLVDVDAHRKFVRQVFKGRSNLESRSTVSFVTTNYDTLLEDALSFEQRQALDGFAGSAIGYWNGAGIDPDSTTATRCHRVLKLHGSVDWVRDEQAGLLRARYGVKYLTELSKILIYPQATKYVETQRDPFAKIFDCFRRSLAITENNLLAMVGYSFGDDHINSEIEGAMRQRRNRTTLIAFSREDNESAVFSLCPTLERWRQDPEIGSRVYVASSKALYNGTRRVERDGGGDLEWWKFDRLIQFLETGVAA